MVKKVEKVASLREVNYSEASVYLYQNTRRHALEEDILRVYIIGMLMMDS
jgi:hypothetical protein